MSLTEVIEEIERLERVAPKLPTLTEARHADIRLAALRADRDALTAQGAVTTEGVAA